jgi:xanthine dehydrogenase large subunit
VPWPQVVKQAWLDRVALSVTGFYMTPEIALRLPRCRAGRSTISAMARPCTEVEIDTPHRRVVVKAVDIVHDVGRSINPAIDIGQIEGAYIQGMGWLTMEECVWDARASC